MDDFDASLNLSSTYDNEYTAYATPLFEGNGSMFGGWIAALLVQVVLEGAAADQRLLSLSIQYLRRVPSRVNVRLLRVCLKSGRTLSQWRCDLILPDGEVAATAQLCIGTRIETERFQDVKMPELAGPEGLEPVRMPFPCFDGLEERFEQGDIWFTKGGTTSLIWVRFLSGAPLTAARLAFLADISPPRAYYVMDRPRPTPTVSMTVNLYATLDELEATREQFLLCDLIGTRMEEAYSGAVGRIWSREGRLLATTEQLQWSPP